MAYKFIPMLGVTGEKGQESIHFFQIAKEIRTRLSKEAIVMCPELGRRVSFCTPEKCRIGPPRMYP